MYNALKFVHVLGLVLLLGNVTASAIWKVFANRTGDARIIAFAQKLVTYTDWSLTLGGVSLLTIGGYGMVIVADLKPWEGWLLWGQLLFFVSGIIWLVRLVPIQISQARLASRLVDGEPIGPVYRATCSRWIAWGAVATVPLVAAVYVMIVKF